MDVNSNVAISIQSTESYGQIQLFFVNTFLIILKAVTLNPFKWLEHMNYINTTLLGECGLQVCHYILVNTILLFLLIKFFFGYVTLASNVIALFPILTDHLPNLLLPSMLSQGVEYIVLSLIEFVLGLVTLKFYTDFRPDITGIFVISMIIKVALAVEALDLYFDFYYNRYNLLSYPETENSFVQNDDVVVNNVI